LGILEDAKVLAVRVLGVVVVKVKVSISLLSRLLFGLVDDGKIAQAVLHELVIPDRLVQFTSKLRANGGLELLK